MSQTPNSHAGASRLSLSSITSEDLWRKTGRLDKVAPEVTTLPPPLKRQISSSHPHIQLFRLHDRKDVPLMLAPTHEEEVTSLVAAGLKSYKDLPLRLYQISEQ